MAVAVEAGLFCTLQAKRCRRVPSLSLSVTAALAAGALAKVAPASLMAWRRMAGRLVKAVVLMAGQAAPEMQVEAEVSIGAEAAVALEDRGRQRRGRWMLVTAARALNRPYLVPPTNMAVAVAAAPTAPLAMEGWVAVGQAHKMIMVIRVQPSQGAEVVAPVVRLVEGQAAPASSSSATRRKPPARRRARRVNT